MAEPDGVPQKKIITKIPMPKLYPETMEDDIYPDPKNYKTFWKTTTVDDNNENSENSN